jgi:hypothetical protein
MPRVLIPNPDAADGQSTASPLIASVPPDFIVYSGPPAEIPPVLARVVVDLDGQLWHYSQGDWHLPSTVDLTFNPEDSTMSWTFNPGQNYGYRVVSPIIGTVLVSPPFWGIYRRQGQDPFEWWDGVQGTERGPYTVDPGFDWLIHGYLEDQITFVTGPSNIIQS